MSRKDKKFIAALVFMQTGVLIAALSISGQFWQNSNMSLLKLNNMYELSRMIKTDNKSECKNKKQKTKTEQKIKI